MKPKPLVALKNFTVPIVMFSPDESGFRARYISRAARVGNHRKSEVRLSRPGAHACGSEYNSALQGDGRRRPCCIVALWPDCKHQALNIHVARIREGNSRKRGAARADGV